MTDDIYKDFTLLVDGKMAFKEIIKCINNAKNKIFINMFIWRDDLIGNLIAKAILNAANRGVKVEISKDRYGVVLEKAEEAKASFFHKKQTFLEILKIKTLEMFYPMDNSIKRYKDKESDLYKIIISHPNISIYSEFKADHSKYYIIDDTLILGGINIEDKENGKDRQGRVYQDYMVKLKGQEYVDSFIIKLNNNIDTSEEYFFGMNLKERIDKKVFEMEKLYLKLIKESKNKLIINMAYFSSIKGFNDEIVNAYNRGVKVTIMIPECANYQDDANKKTIYDLLRRTNNGIYVYLTPKMAHTKLIINDDYISIGSTNITKKAFNQLSELNLFIKNKDSSFTRTLYKSIEKNYDLAKRIHSYKDIRFNRVKAMIENIFV